MISSALKPLTGRIIAVLILLVYSLASPADQNDPALDRLFERLTITTSEEEASCTGDHTTQAAAAAPQTSRRQGVEGRRRDP